MRGRAARAPEPKHAAITCILCHSGPRSPLHFSHHSTAVCGVAISVGHYDKRLRYGKLATSYIGAIKLFICHSNLTRAAA
jgi:hypothetical protein